jgi:cardiolipin synthase
MDLSWIPNAISLMRIFLIAPIILLFVNDQFGWALGLFIVAGLSDGIDGYIAKKYKTTFRSGLRSS